MFFQSFHENRSKGELLPSKSLSGPSRKGLKVTINYANFVCCSPLQELKVIHYQTVGRNKNVSQDCRKKNVLTEFIIYFCCVSKDIELFLDKFDSSDEGMSPVNHSAADICKICEKKKKSSSGKSKKKWISRSVSLCACSTFLTV